MNRHIINRDSTEPSELLQSLIVEIEKIRLRRWEYYRTTPHPQQKRFTQEDLNDSVCPSYKNYLKKRSQRLPSRKMVMDIADYLECTIHERNTLLLAAHYVPMLIDPTGSHLEQLLDIGRSVVQQLAVPAMLCTRDWTIHTTNEAYRRIWGMPPLQELAPYQRNSFYTLFDSVTEARHFAPIHEHVLERAIYAFRIHNEMYQFEDWFNNIVARCTAEWPVFQRIWHRPFDPRILVNNMQYSAIHHAQNGELYRFCYAQISISSYQYPMVMAFMPLDPSSHHLLSVSANQDKLHINRYLAGIKNDREPQD